MQQRAREVQPGQLLDGLLANVLGQAGVEAIDRGAQVPHEDGLALTRAAERLLGPGARGFPAERVAQLIWERLLDQMVFRT